MKENHNKSLFACLFSNINLSVLATLNAILFIPFMILYDVKLYYLGLIIGVNFFTQTIADIILTFLVDKIGLKFFVLIASFLSFLGLVFYFLVPYIFVNNIVLGIFIATLIFSFSAGMFEVTLTPIIDNLPEDFKNKEKAISLLHSLYGYGQILTIVVSSIILFVFGNKYWNFIPLVFSIIPLLAFLMFLNLKITQKEYSKSKFNLKICLSSFFIIALFVIMFGAGTEILLNQFITTFLVIEFQMNKQMADLLGMAVFALFLSLGRSFFSKKGDKINISKALCIMSFFTIIVFLVLGTSNSKLLTLFMYLFGGVSVCMLWPGTMIVCSRYFKHAGVWMLSMLAIFGDIGGSIFPIVASTIISYSDLKNMFLYLSVLPAITFILHLILYKKRKKTYEEIN